MNELDKRLTKLEADDTSNRRPVAILMETGPETGLFRDSETGQVYREGDDVSAAATAVLFYDIPAGGHVPD